MNSVTNKDLYGAVESVRTEAKADTLRLEGKVESLQAELSRLSTKMATAALKLSILSFIAASVAGAIVGVVVPRFFK